MRGQRTAARQRTCPQLVEGIHMVDMRRHAQLDVLEHVSHAGDPLSPVDLNFSHPLLAYFTLWKIYCRIIEYIQLNRQPVLTAQLLTRVVQ